LTGIIIKEILELNPHAKQTKMKSIRMKLEAYINASLEFTKYTEIEREK
jgi:hypothetical protein